MAELPGSSGSLWQPDRASGTPGVHSKCQLEKEIINLEGTDLTMQAGLFLPSCRSPREMSQQRRKNCFMCTTPELGPLEMSCSHGFPAPRSSLHLCDSSQPYPQTGSGRGGEFLSPSPGAALRECCRTGGFEQPWDHVKEGLCQSEKIQPSSGCSGRSVEAPALDVSIGHSRIPAEGNR